MIGGSQAAVYYGEPRFTRDVDVVAGLGPAQIHALLARFPAPDFYVSGDRKSTRLNSSHQIISYAVFCLKKKKKKQNKTSKINENIKILHYVHRAVNLIINQIP